MGAVGKSEFLEPDPLLKWILFWMTITYGLLVLLTVLAITAWWYMELEWNVLMDSSDFVDWPPLSGLRLLGLGSITTFFVASASVFHFWSLREWTGRHNAISVAAAISMLTLSVAGFVGLLVIDCPEANPAAQLSDQVAAVASFNAAACNAWCNATLSNTLPSVCDLQAAPTPSASFESLARRAGGDLEPWCSQALGLRGHDSRGLVVKNHPIDNVDSADCSPFCRLQVRRVKCLSSGDWNAIHYEFESARIFVSCILAAILMTNYLRRVMLRRLMLARNGPTELLVEQST